MQPPRRRRAGFFCLMAALLAGLLWPPVVKGQQEALEKKYAEAAKAFQSRNLDLAEQEFNAIRRAAPEAPEPCSFLEKIYLYRGHVTKAQAMLQLAVKLKPDFADALQSLGATYLREKDDKNAQAVLKKATRLDPRNAFARLDLGTALIIPSVLPSETWLSVLVFVSP